jgi:PrsW family intramembrane metalloprotease
VPTILPMLVFTLVASTALWVSMLWAYSGRTMRFVRLVPLGLPLSAAVNLLVKGPLGEGVGELAGIEPGLGTETPVWFLLFLFALAPVFEELAKAAPALLPVLRRSVRDPDKAFWTGMALGIGFGLGEAAYLGWQIAASGAYEQYPWYAFTGFFGERLLVVFIHGFMTALFLLIAARHRPVFGFLAAAAAHAVLNSGAMLFQLELVPEWVASLTLVATLTASVVLFERIRPKATRQRAESTDFVYYSTDR